MFHQQSQDLFFSTERLKWILYKGDTDLSLTPSGDRKRETNFLSVE
jgi:hypothetical protein